MSLIEPTDVLTAVATASTCGLIVNGLRAAHLHQRLRTDPLTGLANRSGLQRAFDRTRPRPGWCVAALMIDLNNFKTINDTHGHRTGDQVLIEVGQRLRRYQRRGRLAVRISGDEFVLWLGTYANAPATWIHVNEIARDVATSIAEPMHLDSAELVVTASVGTGIASAGAATLEDLLEPADHAMYADKHAHHGRAGVGLPSQRGEHPMSDQHDWRQDAACAEIGTDMFYPNSPTDAANAIRICHTCPVEQDCLDWALATGEIYGIWGGTTPKQRRALRRE